jgi:phospholipid/cholesterol/gamma-HCH transport system substrate-binding protein
VAGSSAIETVIGACVVVAAVAFVGLASRSANIGEGGGYPLSASFASAEGISVGTDVRMAGVKIGTVTEVSLNPETYQAELRFNVRDGILIPDDSEVKVASEGLLGGSFLELSAGGSEFMLNAGDEVLMTQSAVSLLNLLLKFASGQAETE